MNKNLVIAVVLAFVVGGVVGYGVGITKESFNQAMRTYDQKPAMGMGQHHGNGPDGRQLPSPQTGMMNHKVHAISTERQFIEEMIPHHEEAVRTAKEVLARGGTTPEIRSLAEGIVSSQEKEITDMRSWYTSWYGTPYTDTGTYSPMMRDLSTLSGAMLDQTFLEDMVHHHMGAIMMAKSVTPNIEHAEMTTLTKAIIENQTREVATMNALRAAIAP